MNKGTFYSVGVGPGDPSLMTIKAVETIKTCDVIISPDSGGKENVALNIAEQYIAGKRVEHCPMPMTRDQKTLNESHAIAAAQIAELLDQGLSAAFLTIGDPTIYSTAMYVHKRLAAMGYRTKIIPGVPSFCAAAAAANETLCEGAEAMHIIPASYSGDFLQLDGTKILMKSGKSIGEIVETLKKRDEDVFIVRRASMADEKVFHSLEDFDNNEDYFSIIVVKQT
ncbi:MAG: precorrin-2 C(20)-methyltransferase [Oscillospiraceae bacterium]|nr:precorrin-2 C(20)-methyltransferase [Oscillospiraceae bacterium]